MAGGNKCRQVTVFASVHTMFAILVKVCVSGIMIGDLRDYVVGVCKSR